MRGEGVEIAIPGSAVQCFTTRPSPLTKRESISMSTLCGSLALRLAFMLGIRGPKQNLYSFFLIYEIKFRRTILNQTFLKQYFANNTYSIIIYL